MRRRRATCCGRSPRPAPGAEFDVQALELPGPGAKPSRRRTPPAALVEVAAMACAGPPGARARPPPRRGEQRRRRSPTGRSARWCPGRGGVAWSDAGHGARRRRSPIMLPTEERPTCIRVPRHTDRRRRAGADLPAGAGLSQLEDHVQASRAHPGQCPRAPARHLRPGTPGVAPARLARSRVCVAVVTVTELLRVTPVREPPAPPRSGRPRLLAVHLGQHRQSQGRGAAPPRSCSRACARCRSLWRSRQRDVFVSWLPLYHDMGLIGAWMGSLYYGFPLVLHLAAHLPHAPRVRWLQAIHRLPRHDVGRPQLRLRAVLATPRATRIWRGWICRAGAWPSTAPSR